MTYEDQVRRQMEEVACAQAQGECPLTEEVDAAFSSTTRGGNPTPPKYRGPAMRPKSSRSPGGTKRMLIDARVARRKSLVKKK